MIGALAPAAEALDHVVAVHVRQPEVEDHDVRRVARRGVSAAAPSATAVTS